MRASVTVFALFAFAGCGDDDDDDDSVPGLDAGLDAAPDAEAPGEDAGPDAGVGIAYEPCTLLGGRGAECARVPVPREWDDQEGPRIELSLKAVRNPANHGQLWLLQGGPGGSARAFETGFFQSLADRMAPGLDLYMPDHRGTGGSSRPTCPVEEDPGSAGGEYVIPPEVPACAAHLAETQAELLESIRTTNAARDLERLIELTRRGDEPVYVYGVSYGTYWANRYLQVAPEQATGVILDSVCSPGFCGDWQAFDRDHDAVAHQVFDACGLDPECSAHLGPDPWAFLADLHASLDLGACPELSVTTFPSVVLKQILASMAQSFLLRTYMPAVVYRFERCDAGDVEALRILAEALYYPSTADEMSAITFMNIGFGEMGRGFALSREEVEEFVDGLGVMAGSTYGALAFSESVWPPYPEEPLAGIFADTSIPVLSVNGTMDPQTSLEIARPLAEHFMGPHQSFVVFPRAPHGVAFSAPTVESVLGRELSCGAQVIHDFLADPQADLDTSCTERILPIVFENDFVLSAYLFGSADMWEDEPIEEASLRLDRTERLRRLRELGSVLP